MLPGVQDARVSETLSLPPRPTPPDPPQFPLLAALAPLLAAGLLYAVLRIPAVLLFAVLGPVLAVGGVLDGRIQTRRRRRRDEGRHAAALAETALRLDAARTEAEAVLRRASSGPQLLAARPEDWRGRPPGGPLVLGTADHEIPPLITGSPGGDDERRLLRNGRWARTVPFTVPAGTTVAVLGQPLLARCFARAAGVSAARATGVLDRPPVVAEPGASPADLVVRVDSVGSGVVAAAGGAVAGLVGRRFRPAFVTAAAFRHVTRVLERVADVPPLERLLAVSSPSGGLAAAFAVDDAGDP
ncbi:MAG: segregation ATPase FtsK/SpoIIIE, family, partial [Microbacteriaceae bacterium]|nr:segregation ATPase FtsK/SpoIIIE, family [Microbacteriaceae bacterium]